ncbi:MAG: ABC transporter permease [Dehalococcoidia bacterium]|nr:ABC transporter permease [Dehalococcoidia bacterium]
MNTLAVQIKLESRLFLREKEALFWMLAFPVFMMVLFGLIWKDETWGGTPAIAYILPGIIVMAVMMTCIASTATGVVEDREKGIFRRLSLTPLRRQALIGGQIVNRYLIVLAQTIILIGIGIGFFGASIAGNRLLFWGVLTIGTLSFLALGFALASFIKSEKGAHPVSMIVFFTLMFLGGCFFPIEQMPEFLRPVCGALPSLHLNDALRMVAAGGVGFNEIWQELPVLLGWFGGCSALAVKFFKWE